jgi:hypothetical protein
MVPVAEGSGCFRIYFLLAITRVLNWRMSNENTIEINKALNTILMNNGLIGTLHYKNIGSQQNRELR